MGNEGSVPQGTTGAAAAAGSGGGPNDGGFDDAEGLEYQARAPPSSTNPPPPTTAHRHNHHHPQGGDPGEIVGVGGGGGGLGRPGRNMMGAVFTRRGNHAHNSNNSSNQERTGIERAHTAASSPPPHYQDSHISPEDFDIPATDRKGHPTRSSAAQAVAAASQHQHQQQQHDLVDDNNGTMPQHHYHGGQHPPPPPQQPMYLQQQHAGSQQHVVPNQQYYAEHRDQHLLQQPPPSASSVSSATTVGLDNTSAHSTTTTTSAVGANNGRPTMNGGDNNNNNNGGNGKKSSWRQKGIMGSMRNLSLGSSIRSAVSASPARNLNSARHQQQQQQHTPNQQQHHRVTSSTRQVNNWELQWDADEDDEEEEEEEERVGTTTIGPPSQPRSASAQAGFVPQEQTGLPPRPGAPPPQMTRPPDSDSAGYAATVSLPQTGVKDYQQQQQQAPTTPVGVRTSAVPVPMGGSPATTGFVSPQPGPGGTVISQQPHQRGKAHLVTPATPDTMYQQQRTDEGDDGVEWDTGTPGQDGQGTLSEKPTVEQFLPLLRVLGKGSFGKVVLVQKRVGTDTGSLFAMKILKKNHLVRRRQIERTRTERKVLSVVNHPFIMKLHYAFQSPDKLYLVLDYCPGGELFFHLSRFRRFPERVARFYSAELLLALGHLHKRGIIYRDLKPENVLLDADGHVKLGDFGLAKAGIRHAYEGATSMCGTPEYMAPEVLAQQGHGFCVDYWGLGMLTYEMMTGLPPWYTTDRAKLFRRLRSAPLDIPTYFSASSATFTSALLERNPRRRLGVTGIRAAMEHEYFKSISWRALYGRKVEAPIRPCEGWSPSDPSSDDNPANAPKNSVASFLASSHSAANNNTMNPTDLDAATANFDNQFTRMPVESDGNEYADGDEELEELHEDTFVGFTFDQTDRDEPEVGVQQQQQQQQQQHVRVRTQHYENQQGEGHTVD
eukprot:CAMPEP_0113483298 /NCGR_PEP_ID=MMETSP0014_2-20120614/23362_1 /TAXON_ID=2857 /ORGANISM="Nitzschia sp." /LENGTH=945 /DNA_ID=CAMNT_0000376841 /DNA_START=278 /DNA_END=3115 /DNA_ORIENTATION=+ /assembly_acc=CAM_ASM_000159